MRERGFSFGGWYSPPALKGHKVILVILCRCNHDVTRHKKDRLSREGDGWCAARLGVGRQRLSAATSSSFYRSGSAEKTKHAYLRSESSAR
jgi:hypothetical protein